MVQGKICVRHDDGQRALMVPVMPMPLRPVMMLGWSEMRKPLPLNFMARGANKRLKPDLAHPTGFEPVTRLRRACWFKP